jgi:DtxR family Mn-dependent transcriptional regulator
VRRHRLAERLLTDVIGLEWEKVHREADRWEHAISADVEERLVELLGDPATCPHGNPIPGSAHRVDDSDYVTLDQATPGKVSVTRIAERLEINDDALALLADTRLIPGVAAEVLEHTPEGVRVRTALKEQTIPPVVARDVFVRAS